MDHDAGSESSVTVKNIATKWLSLTILKFCLERLKLGFRSLERLQAKSVKIKSHLTFKNII